MTPLAVGLILFSLLLILLIGGVWIAISLTAVAWFGLQFFTSTPPDVNLFQSFWGSSASWTLAALPMSSGWARSCIALGSPTRCSRGFRRGWAGCLDA